MDGAPEIGQLQLDTERIQGGNPVSFGKRKMLLRNFVIILDADQRSFPDVLDTLAATTDDKVHFVRVQVGRIGDVAVAGLQRAGGRENLDIGHGEGDGDGGAFERSVNDGSPPLQFSCAGCCQKDGAQVCKQLSHGSLSPHTN